MTIQACLKILGLESTSDIDQVHRAYRQQVKRWHPDQYIRQPTLHAQAEERLKRINQAYTTLKEHLGNISRTRSDQKAAAKHSEESPTQSSPSGPGKSSGWKKWFKFNTPGQNRKRSPFKGTKTSGPKTSSSSPRQTSGFDRVLRQAAHTSRRPTPFKYSVVRPIPHPRTAHRRKKNMRINGFRSASRVSPVPPIVRIHKIGGD